MKFLSDHRERRDKMCLTTLKCLNFVLQVVDIFCFNASGRSDSGSKDGRGPPKMVTKSTDPGVLFQTIPNYSLLLSTDPGVLFQTPCCAVFLLLFLLLAFFCQQIEIMIEGLVQEKTGKIFCDLCFFTKWDDHHIIICPHQMQFHSFCFFLWPSLFELQDMLDFDIIVAC